MSSSMNPGSILDSVRKKLYGNQNEKSLDKVDDALQKINKNIIDKSAKNYAEIIHSLVAQQMTVSGSNAFQNLPPGILDSPDNIGRLSRYINAEEVCDSVPSCARALKVMADGILSPDDITKKTIQVLSSTDSSDEDDEVLKEIKSIIKQVKIDRMMPEVIADTLKLGDQFIEICDYESKDIPITHSLLTESETYTNDGYFSDIDDEYKAGYGDVWCESGKFLGGDSIENVSNDGRIKVHIDIIESDDKNDISKNDEPVDISKIRLIVHDPRAIIKLQSRRFRMCLGYLVLPYADSDWGGVPSASMGSTGPRPNISSYNGMSGLMPYAGRTTGIEALYKEIISRLQAHVSSSDMEVDNKEFKFILKRLIEDADTNRRDNLTLKIRYVPADKMEHFCVNTRRYFPYGEGIFQKVMYQAKLLIALETAITIKRISDSSDKRVVYVEANLPRDVKNYIEEIKSAMNKIKYSIDSRGTISSVASSITSYETIYVPTNKGQKFVEFDQLAPTVNIRDLSDELKFFRDQVVSGLEVPPAFINLEENLSNKSALAYENSIFAQTILSYQFMLSASLQNLVSKIYRYTRKDRLREGITITFPPPKTLQIERDAEKIDMIVRILQSYQDMGVPKEWAIKKYVDLPWDEIENFRTKKELENKITPPDQGDPMAMGGGMGMMGGGDMSGMGGVGGAGMDLASNTPQGGFAP